MEWKDTGEMIDKEENPKEEYFDEEQYSPWADRKDKKKGVKLSKVPVLFILLSVAIVALVFVLFVLLLNGDGDVATQHKMAAFEGRLQNLEERLDKFEAIDEKVTRIWEQAKSYEQFKDRFNRSEASMSLRMDHLTMSLETLQKEINASKKNQTAASPAPSEATAGSDEQPSKIRYHQVKTGDTLYSISKRYNLNVENLLKMNRMKPGSVIVTGQKLIVRSIGSK